MIIQRVKLYLIFIFVYTASLFLSVRFNLYTEYKMYNVGIFYINLPYYYFYSLFTFVQKIELQTRRDYKLTRAKFAAPLSICYYIRFVVYTVGDH